MRGGRAWIAGVVAVLAVTVVVYGRLVWLAHGRDAAVVEPDFYRRAVAWDSTRAAQARSDALGWTLEAALGRPGDAGEAPLTLRLADGAGRPVEGAAVRVTATHNRIADRALRADLAPVAPGVYAARLPLPLGGLWDLDVEAVCGADRFVRRVRCDTERGSP